MTNDTAFETRNMTRQELDWALDLTDSEGWNPGLHDAECFFDEDPGGFFVATADDVPVGCVSGVVYDEKFGFGGLYIVENEWRELGIGRLLTDAVFKRMGPRNIGQDAVTSMRQQYESMGFEVAFTSRRYGGTAAVGKTDGPAPASLSDIAFADLADFDGGYFPARRDRFLARWVAMPESSFAAYLRGNRIAGYGVIRRCRRGHKIGPLFAVDATAAETVFDALAARVEGDSIYLDIPTANGPATDLARARGMEPVFETHRMYNRGAPRLPLEGIFGISSFEFG